MYYAPRCGLDATQLVWLSLSKHEGLGKITSTTSGGLRDSCRAQQECQRLGRVADARSFDAHLEMAVNEAIQWFIVVINQM